jgi:hypothetical protein
VGADDGGEVVVLIGGVEDRGRGHDLILVDPLPPAAGMEKICLERKLAMEREGELVGRHEWHNPDHEVLHSWGNDGEGGAAIPSTNCRCWSGLHHWGNNGGGEAVILFAGCRCRSGLITAGRTCFRRGGARMEGHGMQHRFGHQERGPGLERGAGGRGRWRSRGEAVDAHGIGL